MKRPTWTIAWNEKMSVGIPEIDEDHKHFFSLILELNRAITDRMSPEEIRGRLQAIVDDAERHFSQEEQLFKQWQYPGTEDHANKHAQALKSLQNLMNTFVPYGHDSAWIDAGLKVKDILIGHILNEDMKYADYYQKTRNADPAGKV